ncbi:hypothetical protein [Pseudomonas sp. nanlin1]|uniref:hypothetical protein n=1 Tax=Pseudomonas sp. nanlin1 TaxID=3040605 RepID=UPI00388D7771
MKAWWLVVGVLLSGCASVSDIAETPETMSVISGKSPKAFATCLVDELTESRGPSVIEPIHEGYRVIVPQKLSETDPAALVDISERSNGSTIKVHERLSNLPIRPTDIRDAVEKCISG